MTSPRARVRKRRDREMAAYVAQASSPTTPWWALSAMATSVYHEVRIAVAGNARCPTEALMALATDWRSDARDAAMSNELLINITKRRSI